MEQELYWIYAFNVIVNSTLSFFTTLLLVELVMYLLRIEHPRVKAMCRLLPFCKICIDFCLYHFSNWALLHGINPILAETGTRNLSIMVNPFTGIQFSMQDGKTFSVADVIAFSTDILLIQAIQASDSMIHRFRISRFALAEAVLKTARQARGMPSKLSCSFVEYRPSLKNRMEMILQEPLQRTLKWEGIQCGLF